MDLLISIGIVIVILVIGNIYVYVGYSKTQDQMAEELNMKEKKYWQVPVMAF